MLAQEGRDVELVVAVEQRIRLELVAVRQAAIVAAPPERWDVESAVIDDQPHPAYRLVAGEHPDLPCLRGRRGRGHLGPLLPQLGAHLY